jgi:hypothetical protein
LPRGYRREAAGRMRYPPTLYRLTVKEFKNKVR